MRRQKRFAQIKSDWQVEVLNKEALVFEEVKLSQRSYK